MDPARGMDNFVWSQIINYYAPAIRVVPLPKEYGIDRLELDIMAGTEPLNKDGSPHITKLEKVVQLEMEDKMVE